MPPLREFLSLSLFLPNRLTLYLACDVTVLSSGGYRSGDISAIV
jgi:hypothetical protein